MSQILYDAPGPKIYFLDHYDGASIPIAYDQAAGKFFCPAWPDGIGAQPDAATIAAYSRPVEEPEPLTDVEIMTPVFTDARRQAALFLDSLKARVWDYLKNVSLIEPSAVTEAGVIFNLTSEFGIGAAYDDFVKNGGHPVAAQALWNRIQAVKSHYSWLTAPVLAIFAAALGQQ